MARQSYRPQRRGARAGSAATAPDATNPPGAALPMGFQIDSDDWGALQGQPPPAETGDWGDLSWLYSQYGMSGRLG